VLGEEFGSHQPDARYRWVLDPIDGTKAFVTGTYLFGTLIALVKDGRPVLGVINNPIIGDYLVGVRDGAWLNGAPVHVGACSRIEDAVMLSTDHWNVFNHQNGAALSGSQAGEALQQLGRLSRLPPGGDGRRAHHDGPDHE
jgi:fructose-1,6-bisphosphatase/inositol monophosphatase family enzyme